MTYKASPPKSYRPPTGGTPFVGDTKERYGTTPKYCFLSDGGCDPPVVHSREEKGGGEDPACFTLTRHKSQAVACQVRLPNCARMACAFFASGDALSCRGGMRARDRWIFPESV